MFRIVHASLKYRFVIVIAAVAMMAFGLVQLHRMPVDVLPEFSPPYVEIQTESLGLSAEEVEQLITVPMEQDLLNGLPWVETIRSESVPGLSSVVLVFQAGTDLMRARQMVAERMTQAVALPHVSKPPTMLQPLSAASRVLIVGLSSKTLSPIQMSVLARWTITPRLMGVPGVANVATWGQRDRQLQVQVDPKRLEDHKVSLLSVLETTANALWVSSLSFVEASTPGTGGFIDTSNQRLSVRHILPIVSAEGLAQVPVEGTSLRLGEVANVVEDHQPLIGDALTKEGHALLLVIEKRPGSNTLEVTRGVEEALSELATGLPGMNIDPAVFRPADFIEMAVHNIGWTLLAAAILLTLALILLAFDWRAALISLVAIPLSMMTACFILSVTGSTFNMLVLTGLMIALGVVVDDAVIHVDNIRRRLREYRRTGGPESPAGVVLGAALEGPNTIAYAAIILLLAVLPIFFLGGSSGAYFKPLAVSYALAVLASLLVALTVTPALSFILLAGAPAQRRPSPLVAWLQRLYDPLLGGIVQRGPLALVAALALAAASFALLPALRQSLLPEFKERNLLIHLEGAPGTSQPEMTRIAGLVSEELRGIPGVRVSAHIGRAVLGDQVVNVNSAQLWVGIDPAADYEKAGAAIQAVVDGYPGLRHEVETYLRARSSDVLAEPEDSIVLRLYGDTDTVLRDLAENVKKQLTGMAGVTEIHTRLPIQQPTLETEVDIEAAKHYGLKPGDVRRAAATLLSGIQVGSLFEAQKVFDVVVWSTPETRRSMSSIQNLRIDTPGGGHVRLGDVAKVHIASTASVIRHESVKRYLDVVVDVRDRDLGAVAGDIKKRVQQIQFPMEYHARILGEHPGHQGARTRVLMLLVAAAIGGYFLLQAAFGSWRLAALACLALPAGLAGGLAAAWASSGLLSLGSLAGLLAVTGISVRKALTLIGHYQQLERYDGEPFGPALALRGARERLGPTLTTTFITALALLPALFLGDVPGLEIVRPMAIVVLGGLITADLVSLLLLPALFLSLGVSAATEPDPALAADPRLQPFGVPGAPGIATGD